MSQNLSINQMVALFLAEALRTRRTSLLRAAEISHLVVTKMSMLETENEALLMLTEIEKDFQEVSSLKQVLHFGLHPSDVKVYQAEIKDYAARVFTTDMHSSNAFLQEAAKPSTTIQELCLKYPQFCSFLLRSPEKAQMFSQLQENSL